MLAAAAGCVTDDEPDATETATSPLLDAPLDTANPFAVGICSGPLNTDPALGPIGTCQTPAALRCTGTLVAPNLVLTAKHCLRNIDYAAEFCDSTFASTPVRPGGFRITTAPSVKIGSPSWTDVAYTIEAPGTNLCRDDIALLVLEKPIAKVAPVPWVALQRNLHTSPPSDGRVAVVGRGAIDMAYDPVTGERIRYDDGNLLRRVLEGIPFVCVGGDPSCRIPEVFVPGGYFYPPEWHFVLGPSTLPGDSGSGVLLDETFPAFPTVIGVTSAGDIGPDGEPSGSLIGRLDHHVGWIAPAVRRVALCGTPRYSVPAWAQAALPPIPPPDLCQSE